MIEVGRLAAEKFARVYAIKKSDLALVADRKPGRPPKPPEEGKDQTGEDSLVKPKKSRASKKAGAKKAKRRPLTDLNRLGIGGIIFVIGAIIYVINLVTSLAGKSKPIPIDGVGLMVLGLGLALLLKL